MLEISLVCLLVFFVAVAIIGFVQIRKLEKINKQLAIDYSTLNNRYSLSGDINLTLDEELRAASKKIEVLEDAYKKLLSQKKSSEVRTGQIAEHMAPFLSDFPFDPKSCTFLGQPIDFISFSEDAIDFIEVKTGKSQLSSSQRKIKKLIKEGKVRFSIYRIKGE